MPAETYINGQDLRQFTSQWSAEITDLFLKKREQYGDSFSDSAKAFKHPTDTEAQAGVRLFLQREYDKLKRIHQDLNGSADPGSSEFVADAFRDIVGYVHVIRAFLLSQKEEK